MPRVYLSENDRLTARLVSWIYGEMKVKKITQRTMADKLQISQAAFAQKLRTRRFTFTDFVTLVKVLEPEDKDLVKLLGR